MSGVMSVLVVSINNSNIDISIQSIVLK